MTPAAPTQQGAGTPGDRLDAIAGLVSALDQLGVIFHAEICESGFYQGRDQHDPEFAALKAALIASEAHELFDALRCDIALEPAKQIPDFTQEENELADVVIRALDYAAWRNVRLGAAILAKCRMNRTRGAPGSRFGGKLF